VITTLAVVELMFSPLKILLTLLKVVGVASVKIEVGGALVEVSAV
jgi:hypothetical protein